LITDSTRIPRLELVRGTLRLASAGFYLQWRTLAAGRLPDRALRFHGRTTLPVRARCARRNNRATVTGGRKHLSQRALGAPFGSAVSNATRRGKRWAQRRTRTLQAACCWSIPIPARPRSNSSERVSAEKVSVHRAFEGAGGSERRKKGRSHSSIAPPSRARSPGRAAEGCDDLRADA